MASNGDPSMPIAPFIMFVALLLVLVVVWVYNIHCIKTTEVYAKKRIRNHDKSRTAVDAEESKKTM